MSDNRYLVTARKYRPQQFREIVAQEHVSETLKNAIRLDRLAHAYLFSGPRGVGKTTAARILAKAINCATPLEQRDQGEPCRACESCKTFEEGRSLSILEIDAASNNKVEDIRELRETILIPPQGSKKKVYIIDEVHMLSNAAFNALLKTLEEPPPHALFIFATTEPNKVLPTILSRCQRFDFRRIAVSEIVDQLQEICREEHIQADEASLMLIAHKGDGAMRDALSAFDQAVSLCGTSLMYEELAKAFGVVGVDLFFDTTTHVRQSNSAALLLLIEQIMSQGYDLQEFLVGLAGHIRNLLVATTMGDTALIEAAESVRKRYQEESTQFSEANLLRLLMIVAEGESQLKTSVQPRLQMELTLLKMAAMSHTVDLKEALKRLDELASGEALRSGRQEGLRSAQQDTQLISSESAEEAQGAVQNAVSGAAQALPPTSASETTPPQVTRMESQAESSDKPSMPTQVMTLHSESPGDAPSIASPLSPKQRYENLFGTPALTSFRSVQEPASVGASAAALKESQPVDEENKETSVQDVEWVRGTWKAFVSRVKEERIHVSALLQHSVPLDVRDGTLVLSVPDEFHKRMLSNQNDFLLEHLSDFVSLNIQRMSFVIDIARAEEKEATEQTREVDPHEYMQAKRKENPVIKAIFDDFGGEMVW